MITEHALPKSLCRGGQPLRVLIVGAGGNGSAVLLGLPYLHQAMKVWGHAGGIHVMLVDGDQVTETNCVRQPFAAADTKLCVAPYWNVYDTGSVCLGSMRAPEASTVAAIPQWEQSFYESEFTHGNVGRLTRHSGGFEGLWKDLAGKDEFPIDSLIELPETVAEFLSGKRRGHDQ